MMLGLANRCSFPLLAMAVALGCPISGANSQQRTPDIFGIFGRMMNSAVADQTRRQWQNRSLAEYNCLEAHNMSADQLAANGIGPNDRRVQRLFAQCAEDNH